MYIGVMFIIEVSEAGPIVISYTTVQNLSVYVVSLLDTSAN